MGRSWGVMWRATFGPERLRLSAGDRLLLYTDGVSEAASDTGEEFGDERLAALLDNAPSEPLPEQYAHIMARVRGHAAGGLTDDATLLLLSVTREARIELSPLRESVPA